GLALPPRRGLDVRRHLRERARQEEKEEGGWALDADPLAAVAAALGAELPALPPPQVPHLPGPPQQQVAGGTLPPPPPSKDELIDRVRAAGYVAPRKRSRAKAKVQAPVGLVLGTSQPFLPPPYTSSSQLALGSRFRVRCFLLQPLGASGGPD
ncbi:unnamed protein product, partial [Prorocentrum cordatum]